MMRSFVCLLVGALLLCQLAPAQETRGSLVGRVADPSGAVIPNAQIEVVNQATGVVSKSTTNSEGQYYVRYLLPGLYKVTASSSGFKTSVRDGIEVRINDRIELNFTMEIGAVGEKIEVTGQTPLLETASASLGAVTDQRRITDLPLMHGNPMAALELTPGLAQVRTSNLGVWGGRPYDNSWTTSYAIDGALPNTSEISMDGIPNTTTLGGSKSGGYQTVAYTPPADLVQEVKVQTASFDASTGFTSGSTINFSVKSGTNQLHGTAALYRMWPGPNAASWFSNRNNQPKASFGYKRWDGTATGPVFIPRVYNGKDKTFFSYGYGGQHDSTPYGSTPTVPTTQQLTGDFSALLKVGSNYQVYDPATARLNANGRVQRDPFVGNILPASRISNFSKALSNYWCPPTAAGTADGGSNLPQPNRPDPNVYYSHLMRIDQTITPANRMYGRFAFSKNIEQNFNDYYNTDASGVNLRRRSRSVALDDVHVFNPSLVLNLRYGYTRFIEDRYAKSLGTSPTKYGFDQNLASQIDPRAYVFPTIAVSGYSSLGNENPTLNTTDVHTANISMDRLAGTHSIKFGVDLRWYRSYSQGFGQAVPRMDFDSAYTLGPLDTSSAAPRGQALAAFLLGVPTSATIARNDSSAIQSIGTAPFIQDDWKVRPNLLVSFGLRWEYEGPTTERFNRATRGYDFTTPSPYEATAKANYAANPVAALPASQFRAIGGLLYAGVNGVPTQIYEPDNKVFAPRLGLAWTVTPKTVIRAGYGMFYTGNGARTIGASQNGFSRTTATSNSLDGGLTFRMASLANPFVDGILKPVGTALGLSTDVGNSVSFTNPTQLTPYTQRWQFSIQRELPARVLFDVAYIGNRTTHARITRNLNYLDNKYLSTLMVRDDATNNYLNTRVNNPFYPMLPGTGLSGSVVSLSQLLIAYPQYTGLSTTSQQGYSWYHSLQVKTERRFAQGFTMQFGYTFSKLMQATTYLNAGDPMPERVISSIDFPHRVSISGIYELPFGKGQRFLTGANPVVQRIVGGWQAQGFFMGQSGDALGFGNSFFYGNLKDIVLPNDQRTVDRWFNTDAGFERASAKQPVANVIRLSSRFSCVRADGINQFNLSVIKNTAIRENVKLQFRMEAVNALNHPMFTDPNTSPSSSSFGRTTGEKGSARSLMFGLKLLF